MLVLGSAMSPKKASPVSGPARLELRYIVIAPMLCRCYWHVDSHRIIRIIEKRHPMCRLRGSYTSSHNHGSVENGVLEDV